MTPSQPVCIATFFPSHNNLRSSLDSSSGESANPAERLDKEKMERDGFDLDPHRRRRASGSILVAVGHPPKWIVPKTGTRHLPLYVRNPRAHATRQQAWRPGLAWLHGKRILAGRGARPVETGEVRPTPMIGMPQRLPIGASNCFRASPQSAPAPLLLPSS
ncbi:hypothetical protein VTK73DRAFT_5809 [Phialemonium thermophilum]|uniref:Uncharacterized protein n=1 Tax=Phialemonium thermophilum TaxID=223376 RepID=A0ABR3V0E8_9PEZI